MAPTTPTLLYVLDANGAPVPLQIGGTGLPTTIEAGTAVIGSVTFPDDPKTVTPVIGASGDYTMDAGDVVTATTVIEDVATENGGTWVLPCVTIACSADIGPALVIIFFNANTSLGTVDSAPSINAAGNKTCVGWFNVATTDWEDWGSVRNACVRNINLQMKCAADSRNMYFTVRNGSASAAFAAADALQFTFGNMPA